MYQVANPILQTVSKRVIDPVLDAVEFEMLLEHARLTNESDFKLFDRKAKVAREIVETQTSRALITQTWETAVHGLPQCDYIELAMAPVQSIESVKYYDTLSTEYIFDPTSYTFDPEGRLWLNEGFSWPTISLLRPFKTLVIRYVCGYGLLPKDVPIQLKDAIAIYAAHFWENREVLGETVGEKAKIPVSALDLIAPFRRFQV